MLAWHVSNFSVQLIDRESVEYWLCSFPGSLPQNLWKCAGVRHLAVQALFILTQFENKTCCWKWSLVREEYSQTPRKCSDAKNPSSHDWFCCSPRTQRLCLYKQITQDHVM